MIDCKLLCSDVDRTLVTEGYSISVGNRYWIRKVVLEKGIPFCVMTGRFRPGAAVFREVLGLDVDLCCFNGMYVEADGKVLFQRTVDTSLAREAFALSRECGVECVIFDLDDAYIPKDSKVFGRPPFMSKRKEIVVDQEWLLDDWLKRGHQGRKIVAKSGDMEKLDVLEKALRKRLGGKLGIVKSAPFLIEVGPPGADKARGVKVLCDYYGIGTEQVMSFGDYDNDLGMLRLSGYPVAMGNATDEVRAVSLFVTDDYRRDGVGKAIRHFFYEGKGGIPQGKERGTSS